MSNRLLLVLLSVPLLLGSCNRNLLSPGTKTPKPTAAIPEAVKAVNVDFRFLAAKGKAQFDQQSGNINVRIRKDSVIWISASLIGVEGGRIYITRDSVQVLDKLHREYYAGDFAYLSQRLNVPVTFDMVQALLLGNYLAPQNASTQPTVVTEGPLQRVNFEEAGLLVQQLISLERGRTQQLQVQAPANQNKLTVDYTDFRPLERTPQPFAYSSLVQIQQGQTPPTTLTITYRSVDIDKERLQFPFSVPKGYARKK